MAIPDDSLSPTPQVPASFIEGRANPLWGIDNDYETGGIGLNDPSQGLQVQEWRTRISAGGTDILISSPTHTESILYTGADITEVSCTFDQNMRPAFTFVEAGISKFEWYDTQIGGRTLTVFDPSVITPRVTLDDKRPHELQNNDVLLFYVKGTTLYMRKQRDRYTVEYTMGVIPATHTAFSRVGMADNLRLLFEFRLYAGVAGATPEEAVLDAPDDATVTGGSTPATSVRIDTGESSTWEPEND